MEYVIEDIAVERSHGGQPAKYPFGKLEVGQSFTVPISEYFRVPAAAIRWGRRHGRKFSCRKEGDLLRVGRIA